MSENTDFLGTGRRKTSVARVRLSAGTGKVSVNGRSLEEYFPLETQRSDVLLPLNITETSSKLDVRINVCGGGMSGQAGAARHGISRALLNVDADLRPVLKSAGFLTRDQRMKERKKYGQPGARRRFQYSKR